MSREQQFQDSLDAGFRQRALTSLVAAAINNVGAATGTVGADKRTAYARLVLANPAAQLEPVMLAVVADGTAPAATDAVLDTRIGNLWNALSGVRADEG